MAFKGRKTEQDSGWLAGERLPACPPPLAAVPPLFTPPQVPRGERGAGGGDTHRPRLPVWASWRMRCSCLFIILGPGWGPRGHGRGRGPAAPRPSLLPRRRFAPDGWAALALPGLPRSRSLARSLSLSLAGAVLSSPAHDSAPGPQVTPLSKFGVSLFPGFRAPADPRPPARDSPAVRAAAVHCGPQVVSRLLLPAPRPAPPPWREAGKPAPASALPPPAPSVRTTFAPLLKEKEGSLLRTGLPDLCGAHQQEDAACGGSLLQKTSGHLELKATSRELWLPGTTGSCVPLDKSLELCTGCL